METRKQGRHYFWGLVLSLVLVGWQSLSACWNVRFISSDSDATSVDWSGDPVELSTGAHFFEREELRIPGSMELVLASKYFSNVNRFGHFGRGWQWNMDMRLSRIRQGTGDDIYAIIDMKGFIRRFDLSGSPITVTNPRDSLIVQQDGFQLKVPEAQSFHFNSEGLLEKIEDRVGNAVLIEYDTLGGEVAEFPMFGKTPNDTLNSTVVARDARPVKLYTTDTDSSRSIVFSYNEQGYIETATDFTGRQYSYEYNSYGNLTSITDPLGNTKVFDFNEPSNPFLLTGYTRYTPEPENAPHIIRLTYDESERVTEQIDRGYRYTFSYPDSVVTTADTTIAGETVSKVVTVTTRTVNEYNNNGSGDYLVKSINHVDTSVTFNPPLATPWSSVSETTTYRTVDLDGIEVWDTLSESNRFNEHESFANRESSDGSFVTFEYDSFQRISRLERHLPSGRIFYERFEYQGQWNDTVRFVRGEEGADSSVTTYSRNAYGKPDTLWRWYNQDSAYVTVFEYDQKGRVTKKTDHEGRQTAFQYDYGSPSGPGFLTRIIDPAGNVTEYDVDALGRILRTTDPRGYATSAEYDSLGRKVAETTPDSVTSEWTYEGDDLIAIREGKTIADTGRVTQIQYDSYGRIWKRSRIIEDGSPALLFEATHDSAGYILTAGDDAGTTTYYTHDGLGRRVAVTDAQNKTERITYDDNGYPLDTKDRNGNITRTVQDFKGRVIEKIDANNMNKAEQYRNSERFIYNYHGKLDSVVDVRGNATVFEYDPLGRMTTKTDPLGMQYSYQYDCRDLVTQITNPNGSTVELFYDDAGRMVEKHFSVADSLTYYNDYDSTGNLIAVLRGTSRAVADTQVTRAYDKANRLVVETQHLSAGGSTVAYSYDNFGRRVTRIFDGDTVRYSYNRLGQMDSVFLNGTLKASYDRCVCGVLNSKSFGNGVDILYSRDNARRLTGIVAVSSANDTLQSIFYTLDDVGNVTEIVRDGDTNYFDYDLNYQLTYAEYADSLIQEFTYDDAGNRTRLQESGTRYKDVTYTFNAMNQLVSANDGTTWEYDSLGNMIEKDDGVDVIEYTYSPENRLIGLTKNSVWQAGYQYDFQGRRLVERTGSDTTQFIWDQWNNLADADVNGNIEVTYLTGLALDEYILREEAGSESYFIQDRVNSVVGLADSSGTLSGWNKYEAFGAIRDSCGTARVRQAFTGRFRASVSALQCYRNRWYQQTTGRFLSLDPLSFRSGETNLYLYVSSNPLAFLDPLGLERLSFEERCESCAACAIGWWDEANPLSLGCLDRENHRKQCGECIHGY